MEITHRIHPYCGVHKKGKEKENKKKGEASGAARAGVMGVVVNENAVGAPGRLIAITESHAGTPNGKAAAHAAIARCKEWKLRG